MPPPLPPRVKLGRITIGKPIFSTIPSASSIVWAKSLTGRLRPIFSIALLKRLRSSAFFIDSSLAPIISTPFASSTPDSASATAVLRPVCPPMVGNKASGFSISMIFATASGVIGSI